MEEKIKMLKEQIYAELRGEPLVASHIVGGRCSGKTYALICAMDECIHELYDVNQALLSNQKSIIETNGVLLRQIIKLSGCTDVENVINGKSNS